MWFCFCFFTLASSSNLQVERRSSAARDFGDFATLTAFWPVGMGPNGLSRGGSATFPAMRRDPGDRYRSPQLVPPTRHDLHHEPANARRQSHRPKKSRSILSNDARQWQCPLGYRYLHGCERRHRQTGGRRFPDEPSYRRHHEKRSYAAQHPSHPVIWIAGSSECH
jgi:hypothetical protein